MQVVTNPGPAPLQVWFEPWGMPHPLQPGEAFRVVGRSQQPGRMELVASDGSVAVYGWPGSTLRVYNGEVLVDDFSTVFPELPPGMPPAVVVATQPDLARLLSIGARCNNAAVRPAGGWWAIPPKGLSWSPP